MAAYYNYTVPIPEVKNVTQKRIGNTVYIYYTYKRTRSKNGKIAPLSNTIGKLVPDSDPPMMYPNLNYYTYFAESTPTAVSDIKHDATIVLGPYMAFQKIVSDNQLDVALKQAFRDATTVEMILDAAAYEIVNETCAMKFFPVYSAGHMSFTTGMKIFEDSTVAKSVCSVDDGIKGNFLNAWAKSLEKSREAVVYTGSTGITTQKGEKPTNYAVAYDAELELPVYYAANYGNLPDLSAVMEELYALGYEKITNVQDGSNLPKKNVFKQLTSTVNPMVVWKGIRKTTSEYNLPLRGQFEGMEQYRIPGTDMYARTEQTRLNRNDAKVFFFHVFYDEYEASRQKRIVNQTVDQYQKELEPLIGSARADEVDTKYIAYFDLQYSEKPDGAVVLSSVERNVPAIQRALNDAGYLTIITPDVSSAVEAYKRVLVRDLTEKLLTWDKPFLGVPVARDQTEGNASSNARGRFFVGFIASIIRAAIYHELKKRNRNKYSRLYGCTVSDVVKELEGFTALLGPDAIYHLQPNESPMALEVSEMLSVDTNINKNTISKLNHELGLSARAASSAPAVSSASSVSLRAKVDRLCGALDILKEAYVSLVEEASADGKDIDEIKKQVAEHIHPDWAG